jgi:hypothetical protein
MIGRLSLIYRALCKKRDKHQLRPKDMETRYDADGQHLKTRAGHLQENLSLTTYEESIHFASIKEPKEQNQTRHSQQEDTALVPVSAPTTFAIGTTDTRHRGVVPFSPIK